MTSDELNEVRNLGTVIKEAEKELEIWRRAAAIKTPELDGLPKSHSVDSRVERIAIKITDAENALKRLNAELEVAKARLEKKICAEVQDATARALLIFRYVDCMYFRDIGFLMGYSEAHVYYLHRNICENLIVDNSPLELHNSQTM